MTDIQLTTIIATYGAVIATLGFVLALILGVHEIRREKVLIKISIGNGTLRFQDDKFSEPFIIVNIVNAGKGIIVINSFGFLLKNGSSQIMTSPYMLDLPHGLQERRSCVAGYAVRWFRKNNKKEDIVAVFIKDETGQQWKTKITKKMKKKWLALEQDEGIKIEWSPEHKVYYREDYGEIDHAFNTL